MWLRDGTSDVTVLFEVFGHGYDRPPECLGRRLVRRVWDLGSNIGLTIAYLAHHFPEARISGVELDGEIARLARINTIRWAHRCSVLTGAVWTDN